MISEVKPQSLDLVWKQLLPMVERALATGQGDGTTSDHIKECIRRGDMTLWVGHEGEDVQLGVVLSVNEHPGPARRKLYVQLLVGKDMRKWADEVESLLLDYRSLIGADCVEASCRIGLAKYLKSRGWKRKAIIMELT